MFNFSIYGKIFKSFTPIKIRYCIFNIFLVCLTVIPDFTDIYWREWYTDVNLAKNNVMVTLIKNWNIWLVQNKRSMHDTVIYDMGRFINNLSISSWENMRESISRPAELVILFCHHLEQRALKSAVTIEHKENSWFIFAQK